MQDLKAAVADVAPHMQSTRVKLPPEVLGQLQLPHPVVRGAVEDDAVRAALVVIEEKDGGEVEVLHGPGGRVRFTWVWGAWFCNISHQYRAWNREEWHAMLRTLNRLTGKCSAYLDLGERLIRTFFSHQGMLDTSVSVVPLILPAATSRTSEGARGGARPAPVLGSGAPKARAPHPAAARRCFLPPRPSLVHPLE